MEPQQFDPETAAPLEEVRLAGLDAYSGFHQIVTDPDALERWLAAEVPERSDEVREIASGLPAPVESLPLWVVAALAGHAVHGALEWFYTMGPGGVSVPEEERQASRPLRAWLARHQPQLQYLRLEPWLDSEPWRAWQPDGPPGGRVDADSLLRQVSLVIDETGNDWWPAAAFVLLRDWYLDLAPLLAALSLPADGAVLDARSWLDSPEARYVIPAGSKIALRAPARLEHLGERAEAAVEHYTERLGRALPALRPDSAWGMLLAFVYPDPDGPPALAEALADEERVLAALREAGTAPAAAGPGYRPATTVTRDYWTTEDTLGYGIYADAIAEFVWHADTRPPLTIGIKAAWGAGKTSLMRMVRERLDPGANAGTPAPVRLRVPPRKVRVTNRTALRHTAPERADTEPEPAFQPPAEQDAGRERATVWFNPWTYQSGEHLWAGLAQAIIDGVTGRMSPTERERFWFELNLARVDRARVRQRIYRLLGRTLVAVAVPGLVLLLGGLALLAVAPAQLAGGVTLAGLVWTVSAAAVRAARFLGASVQGTAGELVRQPDYEAGAGALHLVQADVRRVLDLVATPSHPLVVFVDDLDRCSADVVTEVIEALNLFLAGQYPNCIFVLALEPDVVAAHLEAGRADLLKVLGEHLPAGTHFGMGWRFLDKMVQLPLRLPAPEEGQLGGYIDSVLGGRREEHRLDAETVQRRAERLRAALGSIEDLRTAAAAVEQAEHGDAGAGADAGGGERAPLDEETIRAAEEAVAERLRDDAPEVREVIGAYAELLTRNPRDVKRFINLFRFYAFVQVRRQLRDLPAPSLAQVGKMAILAIRWPYLLSVLSLAVPADRETRVLGALELAAGRDDGAWAEAVVDAGLRERMQDLIAADADLRRVLAGDPPLAAVIGFL